MNLDLLQFCKYLLTRPDKFEQVTFVFMFINCASNISIWSDYHWGPWYFTLLSVASTVFVVSMTGFVISIHYQRYLKDKFDLFNKIHGDTYYQ